MKIRYSLTKISKDRKRNILHPEISVASHHGNFKHCIMSCSRADRELLLQRVSGAKSSRHRAPPRRGQGGANRGKSEGSGGLKGHLLHIKAVLFTCGRSLNADNFFS